MSVTIRVRLGATAAVAEDPLGTTPARPLSSMAMTGSSPPDPPATSSSLRTAPRLDSSALGAQGQRGRLGLGGRHGLFHAAALLVAGRRARREHALGVGGDPGLGGAVGRDLFLLGEEDVGVDAHERVAGVLLAFAR